MAEEMNMMEFFKQRMHDQQMDRLERYRVLNRFAKMAVAHKETLQNL